MNILEGFTKNDDLVEFICTKCDYSLWVPRFIVQELGFLACSRLLSCYFRYIYNTYFLVTVIKLYFLSILQLALLSIRLTSYTKQR